LAVSVALHSLPPGLLEDPNRQATKRQGNLYQAEPQNIRFGAALFGEQPTPSSISIKLKIKPWIIYVYVKLHTSWKTSEASSVAMMSISAGAPLTCF